MVRTAVPEPLSLAPSIRKELHAIDPTAPEFLIVATLDAAVHDYYSPQRFMTALLAVFGAVGLALAAAGVYAGMRYWVASRTATSVSGWHSARSRGTCFEWCSCLPLPRDYSR